MEKEKTEITLTLSVSDRVIHVAKELNLICEIVLNIPHISGKLLCNT